MELPRWGYRLSVRLRALLRGGALDRELDEELQCQLDQLVEANLARGLTPDAARRDALLAIGGIEQRKEECRDARRVRLIGDLLQDLRYAVRTLRRAPAFSAAAILTLALGGLKGGERTLVVSAELWRTRFGADPSVVSARA